MHGYLELIPLDKHWAHEIEVEGNASLEASCSNFDLVAPFLEEAVDAHVALYATTGASAPWIAYLGRVAGSREIVGVCSFKDRCTGGRVEIAYYTFKPFEGQGYGRAMAEQLVDLALRHPDVAEVVAHTLPQESASTRILQRLNFKQVATVVDPEDGEIWQWLRTRMQSGRSPGRYTPITRASALLTLLG